MHSSIFAVHAGNANAAHMLYPRFQNGMQFYDPADASGWNTSLRQPYDTLQRPNSRFESVQSASIIPPISDSSKCYSIILTRDEQKKCFEAHDAHEHDHRP